MARRKSRTSRVQRRGKRSRTSKVSRRGKRSRTSRVSRRGKRARTSRVSRRGKRSRTLREGGGVPRPGVASFHPDLAKLPEWKKKFYQKLIMHTDGHYNRDYFEGQASDYKRRMREAYPNNHKSYMNHSLVDRVKFVRDFVFWDNYDIGMTLT